MNETSAAFSARLKGLLRETGIRQVDLAHSLGIDQSTVSRYVTGRLPDADVLSRIAEFFGVSADYLLSSHIRYEVAISKRRSPEFRRAIIEAYEGQCAVCDIHVPELLQVAHIEPAHTGEDVGFDNALCLCALHHQAFDFGLLRISSDGQLYVPPNHDLKLDRERLRMPSNPKLQPSRERLARRFTAPSLRPEDQVAAAYGATSPEDG